MKLVSPDNLYMAVQALQNGQTIVFPTETSYGLGCDASSQGAAEKIFQIKERQNDKPLLVVVPTVAMAKKYLLWNDLLQDLANKYWPGPLTIIGKYNEKENLAKGVVGADGTVAIRVTDYPVGKFLSAQLGGPVVATSANLSAAGDVYSAQQVLAMFSDKAKKPDIIIDGGQLPLNKPTTIVSVTNNPDFSSEKVEDARFRSNRNRHILKIIRQGQIQIS